MIQGGSTTLDAAKGPSGATHGRVQMRRPESGKLERRERTR
jgi:hypothetical protein